MNLNWYKKEKGFTLIELVMVLAILAMLTLVGSMGYGMIQDKIKVKSDKSTGALIGKELVAREMDVSKSKKIAAYPQVTVYDSLESIESYLDKGTIPESMEGGKFVATAVEVDEDTTKIMVGIGKEGEPIPWQVYTNKDTPGWIWAEDMDISAFLGQYTPEDETETNEWNTEENSTNKYTVQYNSIASETVSNMPSEQMKVRGSNLVLSEKIPVRDNYTFKNWNTKENGKGTSYTPGEIYIRNENLTLYAQWKADEYTVTLDQQSELEEGTTSVEVEYGSPMPAIQNPRKNYTVTFDYNTAETANSTKTAVYTFEGYYTEENGFGEKYYEKTGASAKNWDIPSDTTLYANWTQTSIQLPSPTREGYGFSGWYTAPTGGARIEGASYTPESNITLFAHWTEGENTVTLDGQGATSEGTTSVTATYGQTMPTITRPARVYTVTFNANGGTVAQASKNATYVFDGYYTEANGKGVAYYTSSGASARNWDKTSDTTLYADWSKTGVDLPEATRAGYGFRGWYIDDTEETRVGGVGERYTPNNNITLQAHWGAESNTVILDNQGATISGTSSVNPTYGQTMPDIPTLPEKQYSVEFNYNGNGQPNNTQMAVYTLDGYYTKPEGTGEKYYDGDGKGTVTWDKTENITLYANWTNGGITLPTPNARTGYTFSGWYTASKDGEKVGEAANTYTATRNIVLYAQWIAQGSTVVTLNNQGATTPGTTSITPTYNEKMPEIEVPVKKYDVTYNYNGNGQIDGTETVQYILEGYWTGQNKTGKQYYTGTGASANNWQETSVNTLYAKWQEKSTKLPSATRDGYAFNGWYTASSGGTKVGEAGEDYTPTANITLYAQWGENLYLITLNNQGATTEGTKSVNVQYNGTLPDIIAPIKEYNVTFKYMSNGVSDETETATHEFLGYYTQADDKYYEPATQGKGRGVKNWDIASDTMLYAKWRSTNARVLLKPATKPGYTFDGWYTNDIGGTKVGETGTQYAPSGDITLYAHWIGIGSTVTLDNQDATKPGTTSVEVVYGHEMPKINVPIKSYTVIFDKNTPGSNNIVETATYTFNGYYTGTNGAGIPYYNGNGESANNWDKTVDTTLYAYWGNPSIQLPPASREGYTFNGWYTAINGGTKIGNAGASYTPTSNITLYAQWGGQSNTVILNQQGATTNGTGQVTATYGLDMPEVSIPKKEYTVTYNYNGGTSEIESSTVGYVFGGYYTQAEGTGIQYYSGAGLSTRIWDRTETTELYAKWTERSVELPSTTREGYVFDGWYTAISGGEKLGEIGEDYTPATNVTIYAQWIPKEYTVLLDSNNATTTGTTSVVATYDAAMPTPITKPIKKYKVTLKYMTEGFGDEVKTATGIFNGYYLDVNNPATQYYTSSGASTKNWDRAENSILYGKWNEGSIELTTPTKPHYVFTGWYTDETSGIKVGNGGEGYTPTEDITLYAQWALSVYDVTLNGQGATTAGTTSVKAVYGKPMPIITRPERKYKVTFNYQMGIGDSTQTAEYGFKGYFTETNGNGTQYYGESGSSMRNWDRESATTLYANWEATSVQLPEVNRVGYTFNGWYTASSGGTRVGGSGESYTPTAVTTLYAQWTLSVYTITLNNQSATSAGSTAVYEKYNTGIYKESGCTNKMTTSTNAITKPTKTGYTFGGYYTETSGSGTQLISATGYITSNFTTTKYSANAEIYAKWTPVVYTITLNNQSATSAGSTAVYEKYNTGIYKESGCTNKMTTSTNAITKPTKTGYTFGGYYTETGGSGTQLISATGYITSNFTTTKYSANTEIYAKWTANTYTVTLNNQNATTAGTTSVTATYAAAMPTPITTPSRAYTVTYDYATDGVANDTVTATYTFGGYYDATNGGGTQYYTAAGASARNWDKTSATTLYAKWTSASVILPNPTRGGYNFTGWNTVSNGSGTSYSAGGSYTPDSNTTLYAQWERRLPQVGEYVEYIPSYGSGTVLASDSGYTSDQTYYPSSTTLWRIFSIDDGVINIIPATRVADITVNGKTGHGNLVSILDSIANNCMNSTYAQSARSIGYGIPSYIPTVPMFDMTDIDIINNGGLNYTSGDTLLAYAKTVAAGSNYSLTAGWIVDVLNSSGTVDEKLLHGTKPAEGVEKDFSVAGAVRPVVTLKANTNFVGGTGTQSDPYRLGTKRTITYNANGGSGAPPTQYTIAGSPAILSNICPTREGYNFAGWNTASDGSGTTYQPGATYSTNTDITLYAQWLRDLQIGAYVTYAPSVSSATALASATGYTSNQTYYPSTITSWRIFSIDNGVISIIPAGSGADLYFRGQTGWDNYIETLNAISNNYVNSTYAASARNLGYDSNNTYNVICENDKATLNTYTTLAYANTFVSAKGSYAGELNGIYGAANYIVVTADMAGFYGGIDGFMAGGAPQQLLLSTCWKALESITNGNEYSVQGAVRPIVTLKSNIRITGGSGTSGSPYTLGF